MNPVNGLQNRRKGGKNHRSECLFLDHNNRGIKLGQICFLSGLEIPSGRFSKDHWFPKSLIPRNFYSTKQNIFPAEKTLNEIKSNMLPCRWTEKKFDRVWFALQHYRLKPVDKDFLQRTLDNWETYKIEPCTWCIMQQKCQGRQK